MGKGAVRSQIDIRICFRVRERKDVDLVLGQGMLSAGWHAHTLNAPGKFLISAPEHDTPRRARAYLLTDETVQAAARQFTGIRPDPDTVTPGEYWTARDDPDALPEGADPESPPDHNKDQDAENAAETVLWSALTSAPESGVSVTDLMTVTGRGRRWVYYRLRELASSGRVVRTMRGLWRAATPGADSP
jgi:S-DNA-T family DNA segregation ATPase FtsK/SpoIIIE